MPQFRKVIELKGAGQSPWHGACFDVKSGDIEDAPGLNSLQTFKARLMTLGTCEILIC